MQNDIKIGMQVSSNGTTDAEISKAERLKRAYDEANRSAGKVGGTKGSRAAAAMAAGGSAAVMSGQEYGQARGSAGVTGASARDFANQAQGLGGLVRLYATYAANVFAVGAAFTALKNAADTTNLIKGLDQLGAKSGMALGSLSKRLVEVADGAISMRDAMEAVSKASSAGLTSDQILRLGNVAKKASQALGVDMADAFSRLTRGISKLEPELLDELGIFTKIDPAVQKYALSVGRAASSLTDFERRQAFAIAALEEGEAKFNAIKLDANPYAKLLATLKDVGQTVLEVVNVAITPLVNYLASSPTALLTVLGAVATLIVKQALPAFGQFRSGLEQSAEEARNRSIKKAQEAAEVQKQISDSVKQKAEARIEAEVQKVVAAETKITQLKQGSIDKQSKLYKILEKDLENITERDLKRIDATAKGLATKGLEKQAEVYRETATAIRSYQAERKAYDASLQREIDIQKKATSAVSVQGQVLASAEAAKRQAIRSSIVTNAAYQGSLVGVARAMQAVNAQIVTAGITGIAKFTLQVQAAGAAIAGAISTIGATIQRWLGWVGLILTAYAVFDSFADGASSSVQKFNSAVDDAKSSAENLLNTYKDLNENTPFSNEAVKARGTALGELSSAFNKVTDSGQKALEALNSSTWSRIKNNFAEVFGGGVRGNFAEAIANQITALLAAVDDPKAKQRIAQVAKLQLDITELNFDSIVAAAKRLGPASVNILELGNALRGVATEARIAGLASDAFASSFTKVSTQVQQINQKFAVNDDLANFAINSATSLNALSDVLSQGVEASMNSVVTALEGIGKGVSIFGNMTSEVVGLAREAKALETAINKDTKSVAQLEAKLKALQAQRISQEGFSQQLGEGVTTFDAEGYNAAVRDLENRRQQVNNELLEAQKRLDKSKAEFEVKSAKVASVLPEAAAFQTEQLALRLGAQIGKGANQFLQGLLSSFDAIPEFVERANKLKLQEIDTQIANTKALRDLTTATILSAQSKRVETAQANLDLAMRGRSDAPRIEAEKEFEKASEAYKLFTEAVASPVTALKKLAELERQSSPIAKQFGDEIRQLAARTVEANTALSGLGNQRAEAALKGKVDASNAAFTAVDREFNRRKDLLEVEQQSLQIQRSNADSLSVNAKLRLATDEQRLKVNQANLQYEQSINNLAKDTQAQIIKILELPEQDRGRAIQQLQDRNLAQVAAAEAKRNQAISGAAAAADKERLDLVKQRIDQFAREQTYIVDNARLGKEGELQRQQILLDTTSEINKLYAEAAGVDARVLANLDYQNTLRQALADRDRTSILANAELQRQQIQYNAEFEKLTLEDLDAEEFTRRSNNLTREFLLQKTQQEQAIRAADLQYQKTLQIADANKKIKDEQAGYNDLLATATSLSDSLKMAFDGAADSVKRTAEALGTLATTFAQITINSEKRAKSEELATKAVADAKRDVIALQQEGADDAKAQSNLTAAEKALAAQRKKNAKEQLQDDINAVSSAKRLFKEKTGAYRVLSAMEKAMHVQKLIMNAAEIASDLFKTGQAIVNSITRTAATGVEAGASGTAAIVNQGRGDPYTAFPRMAAMAALVAAILGKSASKGTIPAGFSAKEQQEVQGTGQQFVAGKLVTREGGVLGDNKALADSITSSIDKLAQEFFGSLGSGSSKIVQALESIKKNTGETVKALLGNVSGFGMPGSAFGTVESSSKKLGGLWGSASTSIADAGVRITGTLEGLGRAIGQFEQYENVVRTSSSWFGLVKSTSTETNVKAFEESTTKLFANIFKSVQTVLLESAVALEGPTSTAAEAIKNIPVQLNVSLKGLTGEQAVEAVLAELSVQLNRGAQLIFPYVAQYQRIGEELYETVARIVKDSETLKMGLERVGIAIQGLGTEARIALEQQLLDQLGGVDKAVNSINFYYENFLTSQERFRIQFNQLTKTFRDAGRTLPQTKADFISLLSSLDIVNKPEDQKTFALLINNAEKYNELLDLQGQIIGDTKEKFKEFAKSLLSFKDSLLLGSATILTPIERYAKAKTEFETIRAKALAGDEEGLSKLQDASQTFLNVSRELYASGLQYTTDFNSVLETLDSAALEAKKQADKEQMQLDALNTQVGVLQNIERILTLQESRTAKIPTTPTQQQALTIIEDNAAIMRELNTTIGSFRDLITDLGFEAPAANGGYRSGITLVGERGPEYVDFNTPGRVYTAEQTQGMFAAPRTGTAQTFSLMVSELQDLREEVTQLRKEQQRQTGDMIMTNYDAQQQVAEQIVTAVIQSVSEKDWQEKSKPTLK
jgi:hypothetical protein